MTSSDPWLTEWLGKVGINEFAGLQGNVYSCVSCGCIFIPMAEGQIGYLDRYEFAGGCDATPMPCACHNMPATIQYDVSTLMWYPNALFPGIPAWGWGASPRADHEEPYCYCGEPAVAFLNIPVTDDPWSGPQWACADSIGTVIPDLTPSVDEDGVFEEPDVLTQARLAAEVMLATCPEILHMRRF